jgi:hypothetical protein
MKKTIKFGLLTILISISMSSCISMQSVSVSSVKPSTGTEVRSSAGGLGVLNLTVPRNIAEKATYELKNKGAVSNVSTVMTVRDWWIVQYYRVTATGQTEAK